MPLRLTLAAGALLALSAPAQSAADPCAAARDPLRCEARQAALKTCAAKRGTEKQKCIEAGMPPPDCRRSQDPSRCEAEQRAHDICRRKAGRELKQCLRDALPPKPARKRPAAA